MRILAVSVAPLFPDKIQGGSQRILMEVVDALAESGHEVRVLSSTSGESNSGFRTSHGASIEPSLELRGSFPAPYQTAPHRLTSAWNVLADGAAWADRAYLHADAIYMRSTLGDTPVTRSLHDFVYEESLLSAFTLPVDRTIVPSRYMRNCINASAGLVADVGEITVVPNGIASPAWPVEPALPPGLDQRRDGDLILLHPHRLHSEKGIEESIQIAARVQRLLPDRRVRLLVSALHPDGSADDAVLAGGSVREIAASEGASDLVQLHEWLAPGQMPAYFAAGDVTLCPGSFVEAFGLTPLESVVAGTPAVCSKVGALREQIGLSGLSHFDHGDIAAGAEAVVQAATDSGNGREAAAEIARKYDLKAMRSAYVEAITGPLTRSNTESPGKRSAGQSTLVLAPWCYVSGNQIYHDYLARFEDFPHLAEMLNETGSGEVEATSGNEVIRSELEKAEKLGFLVPSFTA